MMCDIATGYVLRRLSWLLHAEAIAGPVPFDVNLTSPAYLFERWVELERLAAVARYVRWLQRHARPDAAAWDDRGLLN